MTPFSVPGVVQSKYLSAPYLVLELSDLTAWRVAVLRGVNSVSGTIALASVAPARPQL